MRNICSGVFGAVMGLLWAILIILVVCLYAELFKVEDLLVEMRDEVSVLKYNDV